MNTTNKNTNNATTVTAFIGCYAPHINGIDCHLLEAINEYLNMYGSDYTFEQLINLTDFFISEKSNYAPECDDYSYLLTACAAIGQYIGNNEISAKQNPTVEAIKLFAEVYGYDYKKFVEIFEFSSEEELDRNCIYLDKVVGQIASDERIENYC